MSTMLNALWQRYHKHQDADARAEILRHHLGLVHHVARELARSTGNAIELDDLVGAGTLGLIKALESFEIERGLAFTTYATSRIRGAILDEMRRADSRPRSARVTGRRIAAVEKALMERLGRTPLPGEIAAALQIDLETYWRAREAAQPRTMLPLDEPAPASGGRFTLADVIGDDDTETPDEKMEREELIERVRTAVAALPERERRVMALYHYEGLTLRQIGEAMHLTESRVSQIRAQALQRVRSLLIQEETECAPHSSAA